MMGAGRTAQVKVNEVSIGRKILFKENPAKRATSIYAKKLAQTVKAAKQGLTPAQQKLWRQMVYTPAVLQVSGFCKTHKFVRRIDPFSDDPSQRPRPNYKWCASQVLSGKLKFKGLFGKQYKWSDYLIKGAKIIKQIKKIKCGRGSVPYRKCKPKPSCPPGFKKNSKGRCIKSGGKDYT